MMFSTEPPSVRQLSSSPRANDQSLFRHDGLFEFVFSQLLRSLGYQCARRSSSIGRNTNSRSRSRARPHRRKDVGHAREPTSLGTSSVPAMPLTLRADLAGLFQSIHMSSDVDSRW